MDFNLRGKKTLNIGINENDESGKWIEKITNINIGDEMTFRYIQGVNFYAWLGILSGEEGVLEIRLDDMLVGRIIIKKRTERSRKLLSSASLCLNLT